MSEQAQAHTAEPVPGIPGALQNMPSGVMDMSGQMVVLTWVAFAIAAAALHRLLWKPILKAVGERERTVADALEGAAQARQEVAEVEARGQALVQQAEEDARAVAARAMRDAEAIHAKADAEARADAAARMEEARRVIEGEHRKAFETLRLDAADRLTDALERMLRQNLTEEQKQAYQADLMKEVKL